MNNEYHAKRAKEALCNLRISDCSLCVNTKWLFLGASLDGVTNDNNLLEIKCTFSANNFNIKEAISQSKINYSTEMDNNLYTLKNNHNYYYEVQGS